MKRWRRRPGATERMLKTANETRKRGGPLRPGDIQIVRTLLVQADNPLATAEIDLWQDEAGVWAYRANGRPIFLSKESLPPRKRTRELMRVDTWADVRLFKETRFRKGLGISALSGTPLTMDTAVVDHYPKRFWEIAEEYLLLMDSLGQPHPDYWRNSGADLDWINFHREAVGWRDGDATGLRLLTHEENQRRG